MSGIEQKALALVNEMAIEECEEVNLAPHKTLCAALRLSVLEHEDTKQELHDFKQEVSDALWDYFRPYDSPLVFQRFIIPKPQPDPLVEVAVQCFGWCGEADAEKFRRKLDALGFEIREKNDGQPDSN